MHQQREEYSFRPDSAGYAARRRDFVLAQTRKLSWCVAAGATTASIVLGAAFARELPGHHHVVTAGSQSGSAQRSAQQGPARSGSAPAGQAGAPAAHSGAPARHLAPPSQAPANPPPAPQPQVTSGGS